MLAFTPETSERINDGDEVFFITGGSGWLGRALTEMLSNSLGDRMADRVILCGSTNRSMTLQDGQTLPIFALTDGVSLLGGRPAYVCHFAFLTKDKVGHMTDYEYIERNRKLSVLVSRAVTRPGLRGVLLSSSGAVYDHFSTGSRDGAANLYGMLKAEDEVRFSQTCKSKGIPLVVPRIFNVSGPYINKFSAYALSSIIVDVLHGGPVELRARRPVYRSYVHVRDILELSLRSLFETTDQAETHAVVFDTRSDETIEVGELAARICRVMGKACTQIVRPELESDVEDRYVGNPQALAMLLLKHQYKLIDLDNQLVDTAAYIRHFTETV